MTFTNAALLSLASFLCLAGGVGCAGSDAGSQATCGDTADGYAAERTFEGACPATAPITSSVSVTVAGSTVTLTNGTDFLTHCTLAGCD